MQDDQRKTRTLMALGVMGVLATALSACTPSETGGTTAEPPYDGCANNEYEYGDSVRILKAGELRDDAGTNGRVIGTIDPGAYPGPISACYDNYDYVTLQIPGKGWVDAALTDSP